MNKIMNVQILYKCLSPISFHKNMNVFNIANNDLHLRVISEDHVTLTDV